MTTLDTSIQPAPLDGKHAAAERVSQWRVIVSEWIKFFSLQTNALALVATVVTVVALGVLTAAVVAGNIVPGSPGGFARSGLSSFLDHTAVATTGIMLAILILGTIGVLSISGEYSSGMIRATMTAVPQRLPVLWAKIMVLMAVTTVTMMVAVFLAFFVTGAILGDAAADLGDPGVLRALLGNVGYTMGIALLGLALGVLLRSTAGGIATLVAAFLIIPQIITLILPDGVVDAIYGYLPSNAAMSFTSINPGSGFGGQPFRGGSRELLSPEAGVIVFAAWVVVLIVAAAVALKRRDV